MGAACSMPSPPRPLGAADRGPRRRRTRTAPERPQRPSPQNQHPPTAALRLPPLPLPPAAAGVRPPPPLIGYSRARDGADRVLWTSLREVATAPAREEDHGGRDAAELPACPARRRPRGTPGSVVRPQNPPHPWGVPASRAGRTGTPAAPFRPCASSSGCERCAAGQGQPRASPPPEGSSSTEGSSSPAATPCPRGSAAGLPSLSPASSSESQGLRGQPAAE